MVAKEDALNIFERSDALHFEQRKRKPSVTFNYFFHVKVEDIA